MTTFELKNSLASERIESFVILSTLGWCELTIERYNFIFYLNHPSTLIKKKQVIILHLSEDCTKNMALIHC